jgi:uncharacterized cofD-like protein
MADLIVIGPGDLYTSILPNLLVEGIAEAVRMSKAEKVYVCNLMTKHGETDGFHASDFVREVSSYLGHGPDRVILNGGPIPTPLVEHYASEQQHPVDADTDSVQELVRDYLIRHDPDRLIRAIFSPWCDGPQSGYGAAEAIDRRRRAFMREDEVGSSSWRVDDGD